MLRFHFSARKRPHLSRSAMRPSVSNVFRSFSDVSNSCRKRQACRTPLVDEDDSISLTTYNPTRLAPLISGPSLLGASSEALVCNSLLSDFLSGFAPVRANGFSTLKVIIATTSSTPRLAWVIAKLVTLATSPFLNLDIDVGNRARRCVSLAFSSGLRNAFSDSASGFSLLLSSSKSSSSDELYSESDTNSSSLVV